MADLETRLSKRTALETIVRLGVEPQTVIDVGVQHGTNELYDTFPAAYHLLIEPVQEHENILKGLCRRLGRASYVIAAATNFDGEINLGVTPNNRYAAVTECDEVPGRTIRRVRAATLDTLCREQGLRGPFLVKIDVDGHEVGVLQGATEILKAADYVIVESTLFIQLHDVVNYMVDQCFVIYDILEPLYRPIDDALWQVDLCFVPSTSPLRKIRQFADSEFLRKMSI